MYRLEVSAAVRHIYIYIYIYMSLVFKRLKRIQVTTCVLFFCCISPWKPEFDPRTVLVELTGGQSGTGVGLFLKRLWVPLSVSFHQDSILIRSPVRLLPTPRVVRQRR